MLRLPLDRAGENTSSVVFNFSLQQGMNLEFSPPHASLSNGAAERLIQKLWKVARTMFPASKLPLHLWTEAVSHANWLRNRSPNSRVEMQIPFELWYGYKPNLSPLIKFGTPGYAFECRLRTVRQKKLLPRSIYTVFVGMESQRSIYRLYAPSKEAIMFCRVNDFTPLREEIMLPSVSSMLDVISRRREIEEETEREEEADGAEATLARCMFILSVQSNCIALKAKSRDPRVPKGFGHAFKPPEWAEAIDREFDALEERKTWKLIAS